MRSGGLREAPGNGQKWPTSSPKKLMPSSRPCSINRSSFTHRKPRHRPAHQSAHLPQGRRGAPCLFSWGTSRACPLSGAPVCNRGQGSQATVLALFVQHNFLSEDLRLCSGVLHGLFFGQPRLVTSKALLNQFSGFFFHFAFLRVCEIFPRLSQYRKVDLVLQRYSVIADSGAMWRELFLPIGSDEC